MHPESPTRTATLEPDVSVPVARGSVQPQPVTSVDPVGKPRLVALDGLRFLAAVAVMAYHYTYAGLQFWPDGTFPSLSQVTRYGLLGVNLFFLISGFVICLSSWDRGLGAFFVSRVTRLFPAYWVAVPLTIGVTLLVAQPNMAIRDMLVNLTMLMDPLGAPAADGSYWTLWRELMFYLLFAIVAWRGVTYRRVLAFCMLWTVASVLAAAAPQSLAARFIDVNFSMYFIAGVALYLMYRFRPTVILWAIVGLSWILALYRLGGDESQRDLSRGLEQWWTGSAVVTGCFLLMIAAAMGWLHRVRWGWVTFLGTLTYPLYLVHQSIGYRGIKAFSSALPPYVLLALLVTGMLTLAWLIHRFVERPLAPVLRRRLRAALADARRDPTAGVKAS